MNIQLKMNHPSKTTLIALASIPPLVLVGAWSFHEGKLKVPLPLAQKCEKKVINGENAIVCCDKDGKNCSRS